MIIEIKDERSSNSSGHRIYIDGKKGMWHYGPCDNTTLSVYSRRIQKDSPSGGKIIYPGWRGELKELIIDGCPTNHANVVDDFMGGSVCLDCRAVW